MLNTNMKFSKINQNKIATICKELMKTQVTLILIACFAIQSNAQQSALPKDAYGVWVRGSTDYYDHFDDFKGHRVNYRWSEIQPNDSLHFEWEKLQNQLNYAYKNNKYIYASILVGPDSPEWIYDNNLVPKVYTNSTKEKWSHWPYYMDGDYKRLYHKLIREFARFLRTQPKNITERMAFVQIMIGSTGDVGAYKGTPDNPNYEISSGEWRDFNIAAFKQFKIHLNDGDEGKKIPLLFNGNAIHPETDPAQWEWVNNNIDPEIGFGIKGSAYMRGHHLTGEKEFNDTWKQYLVNPEGMQVFSRGEMDQTHKRPLYLINKPLGFYWGMLSGLNTGLSVWDISQSAIDYAATSEEVLDVFRFFNKHAPQTDPATATTAYVIFHEGLNSENTEKFPEAEFGTASKDNEARYEAICRAYSERGARMDHTFAATKGQVWQRRNQTGYNDAGWSIEEGNYERWIEQINPDETSISLFRVRGTIDENSSIYDRFARSFEHSNGKDTMYFKFHDQVFSQTLPQRLSFVVTWLDKNEHSSWAFGYRNEEGEISTIEFQGNGDDRWKKENFIISDFKAPEPGSGQAGFLLINTDTVDDIFHGIEVGIERQEGSADVTGVSINSCSAAEIRKGGVQVYPNPASKELFFSFSEKDMERQIKIFNPLGQLIFSKDAADFNERVETEKLNVNGTVLVQAITAQSATTFKIIVNE